MKKSLKQNLVIHILGWGMIFAFPLLIMSSHEESLSINKYLLMVAMPLGFCLVFYYNYLFLIDKTFFRHKVWQFVLFNLLGFLVLWFAEDCWRNFCFEHLVEPDINHKDGSVINFILRDILSYILTAALALAIKTTNKWHVLDAEKRELEQIKTKAEMDNLKSQLNPHFLFNTLNNIYSLIAINQDKAQYAVHALSKLLRHVLYEDKQNQVSLDQEIDFMKSYIELMALRLPSSVKLSVDMPESGNGILIAPLLFISSIENAFKHGISSDKESFINIQLVIHDFDVRCVVENSYFPKLDNDKSGSGIGLVNLKKRLDLLYHEKHSFSYGVESIDGVKKYVSIVEVKTL